MQLITFNDRNSAIDRVSDSMAIRVAYLFGEKLALTGNTIFEFQYKKLFKLFSVNQQLSFVEAKSKLDPEADQVDLAEARRIMKTFYKIKNKPAPIIAMMKKMEQQIAVLYNAYLDEHTEQLYVKSGFAELSELLDGEIIRWFITNPSNQEKPEKSEIKGSSILSLDFDETNKTKLFLLHQQFFHLPFMSTITQLNARHLDACKLDNIMIETMLTIPNILFLKPAELVVLRKKLADVRTVFCALIDKWINMCFDDASFEERKNLIEFALKPAAEEINNFLTNDNQMEHLQILTNKTYPITIGIAEIPFQLLLDYHLQCGIITGETVKEMKLLQAKNKRYKHKWPVMFYKFIPNENLNEFNKINVEAILSTKKTINVD